MKDLCTNMSLHLFTSFLLVYFINIYIAPYSGNFGWDRSSPNSQRGCYSKGMYTSVFLVVLLLLFPPFCSFLLVAG
jgi:hypothetical protein